MIIHQDLTMRGAQMAGMNFQTRSRMKFMMSLVILRLGEGPTEEKTLGMLQTLFLGSMIPEERLKRLEEEYQLNISEEIGEEVRNMCSYSQVIEDRGVERGIEKGILIYRTLLETKSI